MNDRQNQNWKLGFGLLAGAVLGYWFNSDKGRRVRAELQENANQYGEQAANYVKTQANQIQNTAQQYYEQGKTAVDNATTSVKNTFTNKVDEVATDAKDAVDGTEQRIKKGINRARRKVKNTAEAAAQ